MRSKEMSKKVIHFMRFGVYFEDTFEEKVGRLPVEDEFDIWTLKSSHCGTPQGTQKASKLNSLFEANLIDFEDDGDKQCIAINSLFSEELMVCPNDLQQFCFSIAGMYQQVQTRFAAELHFLRASHSLAKTGFWESLKHSEYRCLVAFGGNLAVRIAMISREHCNCQLIVALFS